MQRILPQGYYDFEKTMPMTMSINGNILNAGQILFSPVPIAPTPVANAKGNKRKMATVTEQNNNNIELNQASVSYYAVNQPQPKTEPQSPEKKPKNSHNKK